MQAEDPGKIQYTDVGGLNEQLRQIREVVELPLTNPELFKRVRFYLLLIFTVRLRNAKAKFCLLHMANLSRSKLYNYKIIGRNPVTEGCIALWTTRNRENTSLTGDVV